MPGRAKRDTFVVELARDEPPALVQSAHQIRGRHAHVVEEDGVDVMLREQMQGIDPDARRLHVDEEHRQPAVLGRILIGPHGQPAIVGIAREARPELLPVDDVVVAIAIGPRLQRGEVGPRARLAVADAEMNLAGEDLRQEELLLLFAAVPHDGRTDGIDREHRNRRTRAHGLVEEHELLDLRSALAAVFLGPADPEPTVLAHLAHDLAHRRSDRRAPASSARISGVRSSS